MNDRPRTYIQHDVEQGTLYAPNSEPTIPFVRETNEIPYATQPDPAETAAARARSEQLLARLAVSVTATNAENAPVDRTTSAIDHRHEEPATTTSAGGDKPPVDPPKTTFASPAEEPEPNDTADLSEEAQRLGVLAAGLGLQYTPEELETMKDTVRVPGPYTPTPRGEQLAKIAARWGVRMDRADIEAATETLYVEDNGPQPQESSDAVPSTPPATMGNVVTYSTNPTYQVRSAAFDRLRTTGAQEPPEVARVRSDTIRTMSHAIGDLVRQGEVAIHSLLPSGMPLLSELVPSIIDTDVTDAELEAQANALGVAVSATDIRMRFTVIAQRQLRSDVAPITAIPSTVPILTEGLTVTSRIDELRRIRSMSNIAIAKIANVSPRAVDYFFSGEKQATPQTLHRILGALDVPEDIQEPLIAIYQWEKKIDMLNKNSGQK